ncbi:hypothetical protein HKX48_002001, partial [Thoreauomyces humboldtii]
MSSTQAGDDGESGETGVDFNPQSLAAEAKKRNDGNLGFMDRIKLPLWLLLSTVTTLILAMVVVPSSTLFITNAFANSEDSASVILQATLKASVDGFTNLWSNNKRVVTSYARNSHTVALVQGSVASGVQAGYLWPDLQGQPFLTDLLELSYVNEDVSTIWCNVYVGNDASAPHVQFGADKWTIKNLQPIIAGPDGDLADLEALLPHGAYWTWDYMELHDENTYWKQAVDQNAQPLTTQAVNIILNGYTQDMYAPAKNLSNFNRMARVSPNLGNAWLWYNSSIIFPTANLYNATVDSAYQIITQLGDGSTGASYGNIYGRVYASVDYVVWENSLPSHACQVGGILQESLDPYLVDLLPSENAIIFVFDAIGTAAYAPGTLLSASVTNAAIPADPNYSLYGLNLIDTTWSAPIAKVGSLLKKRYPDLSKLVGPIAIKAKLGGEDWYIGAEQVVVDDAGGRWVVVLAFPRSDFFASIDRSITRSIIVIVVLAVVGLVMTFLISFALTIPLRSIAFHMTEATQMKFKFLEDKNIDKTSVVAELSQLQTAFFTMVKAFAAGIRKNASLVNKNRATTSSAASPSKARTGSIAPNSPTS